MCAHTQPAALPTSQLGLKFSNLQPWIQHHPRYIELRSTIYVHELMFQPGVKGMSSLIPSIYYANLTTLKALYQYISDRM